MTGREITLSERLKSLADMVTPGSRVADVGCDHGFLSIYLIRQGISPNVLAMDVRRGPLSAAQEHIAEYGLEDYIETRLSDGLVSYNDGEADSLVCAGMGGRLMIKILTESEEKAKGMRELVLQPQSELPLFRRFLRSEGYRTLDENILCEEGKYYFLFKVCHGRSSQGAENATNAGKIAVSSKEIPQDLQAESIIKSKDGTTQQGEADTLYDRYGKLLLQRRHPVLKQYLEHLWKTQLQIERSLADSGSARAEVRLTQVRQEMQSIREALAMF